MRDEWSTKNAKLYPIPTHHDENCTWQQQQSTFLSAVCIALHRSDYADRFRKKDAGLDLSVWCSASHRNLGDIYFPIFEDFGSLLSFFCCTLL
jgi:hypothetical protein